MVVLGTSPNEAFDALFRACQPKTARLYVHKAIRNRTANGILYSILDSDAVSNYYNTVPTVRLLPVLASPNSHHQLMKNELPQRRDSRISITQISTLMRRTSVPTRNLQLYSCSMPQACIPTAGPAQQAFFPPSLTESPAVSASAQPSDSSGS